MQKQKKQFIVVLAALVLLIAAYFAVNSYVKKEQKKEEEEAQISVAKVDSDKIDTFSYTVEGTTYEFKKEDENWVCESDTSIELDSDSVTDMLGNLNDVQAEEELTDYDDLADYGLDDPQNQITVHMGEDQKTFSIGDYNDMVGNYYLKVDGDDNVYLIDSGLKDAFSKEPESLAKTEDTESAESSDTEEN